ncbi:MAG: alpha/beta hydrolase [Myxococcota bacterium]
MTRFACASFLLLLPPATACGDDTGGDGAAEGSTSGGTEAGTDGDTGLDTSGTEGADAESGSTDADGSTGDEPGPAVTEVDCWTTGFTDAGAECVRVAVPVDADDPSRGELEIGVAYLPATGDGSGLPVVALVGGPGPSGSLEAAGLFLDGGPLVASRAEHDVYLIDYRAVGLSEPAIGCAPFGSPREVTPCADAITDAGLELSDITSAHFAADIDAILEGFDVPQVVVWGGSYGTRLGMTLMRDYPGRVAGAVLDGVFPIEINGFTQGDEAIAAQLAFVADRCETEPGCSEALGDVRAQIEAFVAEREPGLVDDFIAQVSRLNRHGAAPLLVSTLAIATDEDAQALLNTLAGYDYTELSDADYGSPIRDDIAERAESLPMTMAIVCSEEAAFIDVQPSEVAQFGWSEQVVAAFEGQQGGAPFPPAFATMVCDAFGAPATPDLEIEPVLSDIPTLIISAGQDVQTPVHWADAVAEGLDNVTHHVVPMGQHVASVGNGCARDMVAAFFDAPTEPVDGSCLEQYPTELVLDSEDLAQTFAPTSALGLPVRPAARRTW